MAKLAERLWLHLPYFRPDHIDKHAANMREIDRWQREIAFATGGVGFISGAFLYGDATDGSVTVTQTDATPSWAATKTGAGTSTIIWLGRDLYCADLHISNTNGAFSLDTHGYRIYCTGTLTIDSGCTIRCDGQPGTGAPITNRGAGGLDFNIGATQGQTAGSGGTGSAGGTAPSATARVDGSLATVTAVSSGPSVTSGGAGGLNTGGPGTGGGVAGGMISHASDVGEPRNIYQMISLKTMQTTYNNFRGGNGGTGGTQTAGSTAGGGGGGGGVLAIYANTIHNSGLLAARGGNGAPGSGAAAGGGGGGGGGAIVLIYESIIIGTTSMAGGSGGAGAGTGRDGAAGQTGLLWQIGIT